MPESTVALVRRLDLDSPHAEVTPSGRAFGFVPGDDGGSKPVANVVEGVAVLGVHHPVGHRVPEGVGSHVLRGAARPLDLVGPNPRLDGHFLNICRTPSVEIRSLDRLGNSAGMSFHRFARYEESSRAVSLARPIVTGSGELSVG